MCSGEEEKGKGWDMGGLLVGWGNKITERQREES